jgi:hypothetical protein
MASGRGTLNGICAHLDHSVFCKRLFATGSVDQSNVEHSSGHPKAMGVPRRPHKATPKFFERQLRKLKRYTESLGRERFEFRPDLSAGGVKRHHHRAMRQILGRVDQKRYFLRAEHNRQSPRAFWKWNIFL